MQVDDDDFERLKVSSWVAMWGVKSLGWYAACSGQMAHREIMGLAKGDKQQVDHIDGNGLNNQKSNLRICTQFQNQANRGKNSNNKSGFKGVSWHSKRQVWMAGIGANGKWYALGRYRTPEEAHAAYCEAAARLHGEFARVK